MTLLLLLSSPSFLISSSSSSSSLLNVATIRGRSSKGSTIGYPRPTTVVLLLLLLIILSDFVAFVQPFPHPFPEKQQKGDIKSSKNTNIKVVGSTYIVSRDDGSRSKYPCLYRLCSSDPICHYKFHHHNIFDENVERMMLECNAYIKDLEDICLLSSTTGGNRDGTGRTTTTTMRDNNDNNYHKSNDRKLLLSFDDKRYGDRVNNNNNNDDNNGNMVSKSLLLALMRMYNPCPMNYKLNSTSGTCDCINGVVCLENCNYNNSKYTTDIWLPIATIFINMILFFVIYYFFKRHGLIWSVPGGFFATPR